MQYKNLAVPPGSSAGPIIDQSSATRINASMPAPLSAEIAPGFDDPLGLFAACHLRIRDKLATLERLQRHLPENGSDTDARAAARGLLKYFDGAAPNHHADEEQSLFPRLAARAADARPLLLALQDEHAVLAAHWRHLRPLLSGIATGQRAVLPPRDVRDLLAVYDAHLSREDDLVLPLAQDVLDAEALCEIGREMSARRETLR